MHQAALVLICLTRVGQAQQLHISDDAQQSRLPAKLARLSEGLAGVEALDSDAQALAEASHAGTRAFAQLLAELDPAAAFAGSRPTHSGSGKPIRATVAGSHFSHGSVLQHPTVRMMDSLPEGANVVVVGEGPIQYLAARLAAIRGFSTTLVPQSSKEQEMARRLCFDEDNYPEGSIPLAVEVPSIKEALEKADALIIAYDDQAKLLTPKALDTVLPEDSKVKHVSLMSRYLNGEGMGFFPNVAKSSNNPEIWNAPKESVEAYSEIESMVNKRANAIGAGFTIIRAGTLKGGGNGGPSCDKTFLNKEFYKLGIQDVGNWRVLYDVSGLGVEISRGDTLPGPGFTAAMTARETVGNGDSHRGAVASALVEALRTPAAKDLDFSVKTVEGKVADFPSAEGMRKLLEKA